MKSRFFVSLVVFGAFWLAAASLEMGFVPPPAFTIGKVPGFDIDGRFVPERYSLVSNLFFQMTSSRQIGNRNCQYAFAWDGKNLICAISTPAEQPLKADKVLRDDSLWEDDSYEIFLTDMSGRQGCHFIINSKNVFYDAKVANGDENRKWDFKDFRIQNRVENGTWSLEFSISLEELGIGLVDGKMKASLVRAGGNIPNEGICQLQDLFFRQETFAVLNLVQAPVRLQCLVQPKELEKKTLGLHLAGNVPEENELVYEFRAAQLDYTTNDAYNQSEEKLIYGGKCPSGGAFVQELSDQKLPERGMMHFLVKAGNATLLERWMTYDMEKFFRCSISAVYFDLARENVIVETAIPVTSQVRRCVYGLRDASGRECYRRECDANGDKSFSCPTKSLAVGNYQFFLSVDGGKELTEKIAVLPNQPEWLNNRLGYTDGKAPAPWTDIVLEHQTAKVWNREVQFAGLPVQFLSNGRCAAKNIRLEANGKPMKLQKFQWVRSAGDQADYEGLFTFSQGQAKITGSIEFDGLVTIDCIFTPQPGETLPDISLKIDIPDGNGRYVYTSEHVANNSGQLAPGQTWSKNLLLNKAIFWVGTPACGLSFVADDLRGWNLSNYEHSATIGKEKKGTRTVALPLLEGNLNTKDKSYSLSFMLQATPTRPMPPGWRGFRINGNRKQDDNLRPIQLDLHHLFNVPVPLTEHAHRVMDIWQTRHVKPFAYLSFLTISQHLDEYKFYSEQWRQCPQKRPPCHPVEYMDHIYICPQGEAYNDYYVWHLAKMLDELNPPGIYFDYAQPNVYLCTSEAHGCAWKDNFGAVHSSMRIKSSRELLKRIYVLLKSKRPDALLMLHNSGGTIPAFHGLCDLTWNGEQLALLMYNNGVSYSQLYEPNKMLLEQNGEIWGVPVFYIPQFIRVLQLWDPNRYGDYNKIGYQGMIDAFWAEKDGEKRMWYLAGLLHVNNADFSADGGAERLHEEISRLHDYLKWDDTIQYHGWYEDNNPWRLLSPKVSRVLVSVYEAQDGCLMVAFNDTKEFQRLQVSIPKAYRDYTFTDYISRKTLYPKDGILTLPIDFESPRYILIKKEKPDFGKP